MIDRSLMMSLLELLDQLLPESVEENALMNEIDLKSVRPVTTDQIREHLREAEREGWARTHNGFFREKRWAITEAGIGALRALRQ